MALVGRESPEGIWWNVLDVFAYLRAVANKLFFSRFPLGIVAPYLKLLKFDIKYTLTRTSYNMLIISDCCADFNHVDGTLAAFKTAFYLRAQF